MRTDPITTSPLALETDSAHSGLGRWRLWQLIDSAFPTGGFAHSNGLESAWQHGAIRNTTQLSAWILASLEQSARSALPFVLAVHREPAKYAQWDEDCHCLLASNPVASEASRKQGLALMRGGQHIFPNHVAKCNDWLAAANRPHTHLAPSFGLMAAALDIDAETLAESWLFLQLRAVISSAIRLGVVGPMEGQLLQQRLGEDALRLLRLFAGLTPESAAQPAPLLDLWQAAHNRLYSRLFQS